MARAARFIFAVYLVWLFVAFVPTHVRGRISLGAGASPAEHSCCAVAEPPGDAHQPTPQERSSCAVCYFASGVLPVVPFDIDLSASRQVELAEICWAQQAALSFVPTDKGCRDPPPFA